MEPFLILCNQGLLSVCLPVYLSNLLFQMLKLCFQMPELPFQNSVFKCQNSVFKCQNSVFQCQNSVFKSQNYLFKSQNSFLKCQNSVFKCQNSRPYSKSSLTLNEWKFNLSFSRVSLLFLNSWRASAIPYYVTTHPPAIQKQH